MLLALAITLNIIENIFPLFNGTVPGVKLGLTNIVILFSLYKYGFKESFFLSITRVFLVSILNTGLFSVAFFLSLSGAVTSIIFMYLFKRFTKLNIVFIPFFRSNNYSMCIYIKSIWILLFTHYFIICYTNWYSYRYY